MKRLATLIAIGVIAASAAPIGLFAQGLGPTAPVTGVKPDRTIADPTVRQALRERRALLAQKRADCRKEAREQQVPLLKRRAFLKDCMSRP
jgi:hypothetical protein